MHAVVVTLTITDSAAAERAVHEQLVPRVSQAPGFITGYWTAKGDAAVSMFIFETEQAAQGMSEAAAARVPDGVTLDRIAVHEVIAQA
jgi:hypothetical protein